MARADPARAARLLTLCLLVAHPSFAESESQHPDASPENGAAEAETRAEETLVTVWGERARRFDVTEGTTVLEGDRFERDLSTTLGQTLEREAGVHNSSFGPGAGRPVIRGFDGNRIRVLQNEIGTLDASASSPDHNVAVEPLQADRVEVVRGAGTLRYGSSAIGGVINVIDGRIPQTLPDDGLDLTLRSGYGSNADERFFGGSVTTGFGRFALHGDGFLRSTDDMKINGLNLSSRRRDQLESAGEPVDAFRHVVPGTDIDENRGGSAGASYLWESGFVGASYSRLRNNYGILESIGGETGVRIDLEQNRFDLAGEWERDLLVFERVSFRGAYGDYHHDELENGEVGTTFESFAWEGRVELEQKALALGGVVFEGLWGFQFETGDVRARGDEAFLPRTNSLKTGLFSIQQAPVGPVDLELGVRWDRTQHDLRELSPALLDSGFTDTGDESFHTLSVSSGVSWQAGDSFLVGLSLSRTERAPSVEELFSGGPHLATAGFERGNPGLDEEVGIGLEATARKRIGRLTGEASAYYTTFDDFIFQRFTGEMEDGLPVREYTQDDAEIWGAEVELDLVAYRRNGLRGLLDLRFDFVRGELDGGGDLPRIAPWRLRLGAEAQTRYADLRLEVSQVGKQDRTSAGELKTDGYTLLGASLALRPFPDRHDLSLLLEGRNLTNAEARNHVSFLKDVLPMPGRDLRMSLRYVF